jgi:sec-independent protein translocase protein TatA
MNVFGIGLPEMVLIFVLALLVFGPKKLPEIGKSVGKAIRGFQEASKEFENEFKREAEAIAETASQSMTAKLENPPSLSPASDVPTAEVTIVEPALVDNASDSTSDSTDKPA